MKPRKVKIVSTYPKFDIYLDASSNWRWRLYAANGEKVASSGESFYNYDNAVRAARTVIAICKQDPPVS